MTEQKITNRRRKLLTAGIGSVAAVAGLGLAWWRFQPRSEAQTPAGFWGLAFDTPDGNQLALAAFRGKPLLLNFWATWCPPCVEELPLLDSFQRQQAAKGWQVVGLAIDQPSAVRKFLGRTPVGFSIGLAGLEGTELGRSLGNRAGGLPFTVVFGADGEIRQRRMGKLTAADLVQWAAVT